MAVTFFERIIAAFLAFAVMASTADAQYRDRYGQDRESRFGRQDDGQRNVAGQFDYYALVLSWSPTYCAEDGDGDDLQCNRRDGRRFNFVLHGLWPQYSRGWPQDCRTPRRPFVPQPLIDSMLDIMPSPRLVIHEYRKHGTCSGLSPDAYFNLARRLFRSIEIPQDFRNPFEQQTISPRDLASQLMRANPDLKPDNFAIVCGGQGNRLKEIRICFSKSGQLQACGANEDQRRMCSASRIFVPPVRSTARDDADKAPATRFDPPRSNPLPAPRMDMYERHL
ncbi:MAG TPA: ribonuclease T2 [Hyphomicrobium sp.]|nr:ribonuclease T2 [Hyphomicrobium sp.]